MKSLLGIVCVALLLFSCKTDKKNTIDTNLIEIPESADGSDKNASLPVMTFENDVHDFGRLSAGERISYSFKFTNTGKADLILTQVTSNCGCTVADYPKDVVKKGESGHITVTFNSSGKSGQQNQAVTVMANTQPSTQYLTIRAQVVSEN